VIFFFALASIFDWRTREVPDKVWLAFLPIGVALTATHLYIVPSLILLTVISAVLTVVISFTMFYFGLFGGADAKAIMCLGATIPLYPNSYNTVFGYLFPFFPITVTITSYLCSALIIVWLVGQNVLHHFRHGEMFSGLNQESRWKKTLAFITGYPVDQAKLRSVFYLYPMEEVVNTTEGMRRTLKVYMSAEEDREKVVSNLLERLSELGYKDEVWATPGLPHMIFLLLGLIITLILGDPIFTTVVRLAAHH
jgi:preflagellin peptidase FlaK